MSAHLVRLAPGRCGQTTFNKTDVCIVWVADASGTPDADARAAAAAQLPGPDGIWSDATVVDLTQANLVAAIPLRSV